MDEPNAAEAAFPMANDAYAPRTWSARSFLPLLLAAKHRRPPSTSRGPLLQIMESTLPVTMAGMLILR